MKKAKLLLSLVMILAVVSMVLFACGDKDAHDCKDENSDHKCDVCETSILCFDNDNNHNCDICGKELSYCFDNTSDHKCELCGETITSCKDENRDHSCDICGKVSSCEDKTNDHKCDVCEKVLSVCADENSDHKCDVCEKKLIACKDEDNDEFCDIYNEYVGSSLSFIKNQDNTYSVYRFDGSRRDVIIPSTYKGLPVTSIGGYVFEGCTSLTSVVIPSSVTSIGNTAFLGCTSLTSIEIPSSVTSIGDYAFRNCTSLTSVVIPSSVTSIGNSGFEGCTSLTSIVIPNSVTSIGEYAFRECTSLASIEIPSSVTSIGKHAFYNCTSLTSIVIPSSVTSIGEYAFYNCKSLTSVVIPSSVTSIGNFAFRDCISLTIYCEAESEPSGWASSWNSSNRSVVWGYDASNLKIIDGVHYYIKDGSAMVTGRNANVTNVTILSTIENNGVTYSVTSIGKYAFSGCTSLTSIEIPSSVTSIVYGAFMGCTSLTSIVIPSSVTSIGDSAFRDCISLTIYCEAESEPSGWAFSWNSSNRSVVWGYDASNLKIIDGVHYYIKDGSAMVTGRNANVINVTILSTIENNGVTYSVTSIGKYAFYNCTSLTSIVIPNSVTSIGAGAFSGCTSLTIYCEAESKPSGWHFYWNSIYRPVVWGYSENA